MGDNSGLREKKDPVMLRAGKLARLGAGIGGLAVCLTLLAPGVARADGAPSTGGGTGPGGDMAVAAGGLAMVLSGGGVVLVAARRRHRQERG